MNIQTLTAFFKWCTIVNIGLFLVSAAMIVLASDFVYAMQGQMYNLPRETFDIALYGLLGLYKVLILVFSLVPYLALRLIIRHQ